jgi:outer membrane protein assembly factor BamE (lipoprotein component of BamABCDE complex)
MSAFAVTRSIAGAAVAGLVLLAGCAGMSDPGPQTLHDGAQLMKIQRGMTAAEVLRALGPPNETMKFARTRTESLDYRYQDSWGYTCLYSIVIDDSGRVVSTVSARLNDGGQRGS